MFSHSGFVTSFPEYKQSRFNIVLKHARIFKMVSTSLNFKLLAVSEWVSEWHSVVSNSLRPHETMQSMNSQARTLELG